MSILSRPEFYDEQAAYDFVESKVWPNGPTCPRCQEQKRVGKLGGKSTRIGTYKCYACRKPFTVKVGTIFESSHVKMHLWMQAIYLMCASKKGISSNQLHRTLGVTLKTAWFMSHRIREAMRPGGVERPPLGGEGRKVEADETYIGRKKDKPVRRGTGHKHAVLSLVQRDGYARSFHVDTTKAREIAPIVMRNIDEQSELMTDEAGQYRRVGKNFADHGWVNHGIQQYVDGEKHTNTVEGFFSIFKRGMKGVYQHCSERHLHRYLAEFDFRYNHREKLGHDDTSRADAALVSPKR